MSKKHFWSRAFAVDTDVEEEGTPAKTDPKGSKPETSGSNASDPAKGKPEESQNSADKAKEKPAQNASTDEVNKSAPANTSTDEEKPAQPEASAGKAESKPEVKSDGATTKKPKEEPKAQTDSPSKGGEKKMDKPVVSGGNVPTTPAMVNLNLTIDDYAKWWMHCNPEVVKAEATKIAESDHEFAHDISQRAKYDGIKVYYQLGNKLYTRAEIREVLGGGDISIATPITYWVTKRRATDGTMLYENGREIIDRGEEYFGASREGIIKLDLKKYSEGR